MCGKRAPRDGGADEEAADELAEDLRLAEAARELGGGTRGEQKDGKGDEREEDVEFRKAVHEGWDRLSWGSVWRRLRGAEQACRRCMSVVFSRARITCGTPGATEGCS